MHGEKIKSGKALFEKNSFVFMEVNKGSEGLA